MVTRHKIALPLTNLFWYTSIYVQKFSLSYKLHLMEVTLEFFSKAYKSQTILEILPLLQYL